MSKFNPEKLQVSFGRGTSKVKPIIPRKYTLTHSDETAELFLTIAAIYDYDKITKMRDEVLAEWGRINNDYALLANVMVDQEKNPAMSEARNSVFVKELPLALQAIVYGDKKFFKENPSLYKAPIYVKFNSVYPRLNRLELWGTPSDYKIRFLI